MARAASRNAVLCSLACKNGNVRTLSTHNDTYAGDKRCSVGSLRAARQFGLIVAAICLEASCVNQAQPPMGGRGGES
jgi:hypothetical protein